MFWLVWALTFIVFDVHLIFRTPPGDTWRFAFFVLALVYFSMRAGWLLDEEIKKSKRESEQAKLQSYQ